MTDVYDIIVVGAGPGGSSAARTASQLGARTLLLEEHRVIGLPRHCSGRLQGSSFTADIVHSVDSRVILAECKGRRFYAPRGRMVLETPVPPGGGYMILRDEFDRDLARRAAEAGAEIVLNTRVTGLLREGGRLAGVETASRSMPAVRGKVVIAAQGGQGRLAGIAGQEGLSDGRESFVAGILMELQRVEGLEEGVLETHLIGAVDSGFARVWTRDSHSCFVTCPSLEAFEKMRRGNHVYSRKVGNATPLQLHGSNFGSKSGVQLPRLVKDGLLLVGDSAGYTSIVHAVVSGRFAAEVAVAAIRDGDVSEGRLRAYQQMCERTGMHLTGLSWQSLLPLKGLSDDEIEDMLPQMLAKGDVRYVDSLPF